MTESIHEQLSAFLDGELSAAESELLLKRIERDPTLKLTLERYVLAGEAVRATQVQIRPSRDFSSRVSAAIEGGARSQWLRSRASQWLKPVAGGAIAAGVAALALVSFQTPLVSQSPDTLTPSGLAAANQSVLQPSGSGQSNVSFSNGEASFVVPSVSDRRVAPPIQVINNGQLANYVVAHSEYSSPLSRRNVLTGLLAEDPTATAADPVGVAQPPSSQGAADAEDGRMLSRSPR